MSAADVQKLIIAGGGVSQCFINPTKQQRQADINTLRGILIKADLYAVEDDGHTPVLMADDRDMGYIGPRYIAKSQIVRKNLGYKLEVANNIAGGVGGTTGYLVGGYRGSYVGALVDQFASVAASVVRARQYNQSISSTPAPVQETPPSRSTPPSSPPPPPGNPSIQPGPKGAISSDLLSPASLAMLSYTYQVEYNVAYDIVNNRFVLFSGTLTSGPFNTSGTHALIYHTHLVIPNPGVAYPGSIIIPSQADINVLMLLTIKTRRSRIYAPAFFSNNSRVFVKITPWNS